MHYKSNGIQEQRIVATNITFLLLLCEAFTCMEYITLRNHGLYDIHLTQVCSLGLYHSFFLVATTRNHGYKVVDVTG